VGSSFLHSVGVVPSQPRRDEDQVRASSSARLPGDAERLRQRRLADGGAPRQDDDDEIRRELPAARRPAHRAPDGDQRRRTRRRRDARRSLGELRARQTPARPTGTCSPPGPPRDRRQTTTLCDDHDRHRQLNGCAANQRRQKSGFVIDLLALIGKTPSRATTETQLVLSMFRISKLTQLQLFEVRSAIPRSLCRSGHPYAAANGR